MMVFALIGAKALYLLFIWLISAAGGAWLAERKGYGERVGLTFGLLLTAVGLLIVLLLPGRPGSAWKEEGWLPRRKRPPERQAIALPDASGPAMPPPHDPGAPTPPPSDAPGPEQAPPPDAQ
ncbi:MAG TPA: hypothetical protein VMU39_24940 [Solirubrobacteraceae bacterium]|nr:hypothetical protein [Solirubrobacteraceae bacterium]